MISLFDFYEIMHHSPLDTFIIYYGNDESFVLMHGETLSEYDGKYENAYVVEVMPEANYVNDESYEWLRVIARMP